MAAPGSNSPPGGTDNASADTTMGTGGGPDGVTTSSQTRSSTSQPHLGPPASDAQANLTANVTTGYAPLAVQFTIVDLIEPTTGVTWALDFGDGGSTSGDAFPASLGYSYFGHGTFVATLTLTTASGGTSSDNVTIRTDRKSIPFEPEEPVGDGDCDGLTPRYTGAAPSGLVDVADWPLLELDVVMIADPTFYDADPQNWTILLRDLLADQSALFEEQLGLRLNLTILDRLPAGSLAPEPSSTTTLPTTGQDNMRATARGFMHANYPDADFDIVQVILGADYAGSVAGQVECVGGAADKEYAYLWSEYDRDRNGIDNYAGTPLGALRDIPLKVLAHETAHLLDAHHHYSDCAPGTASWDGTDLTGACDIMINDIGLASFYFGNANRFAIRSFVEAAGIGEPVTNP